MLYSNFRLIGFVFCFPIILLSFIWSDFDRMSTNMLNEEEHVKETVSNFLTWYKANYSNINAIQLVPNSMDTDLYNKYELDTINMETYLELLNSSKLLTQSYLDYLRTYILSCSERIKEAGQTDGPPIGLEVDLVLKTHEVMDSFTKVPGYKINNVRVEGKRAKVTVELVYNLDFYLEKENGKWLISSE